ncbi:zinc-ribbon domain-containing protein [Streptomyces sp. NPDC002867]
MADLHPELAQEFAGNLENELTVSQLKPHSGYKYRWRCATCNNAWVATPQNRVSGKTGCPACFTARRGKWKRKPRNAAQTAHLALGEIAKEFIRNETTPDHDLTMLRPGSADKCTWMCSTCGYIWVASVASRVNPHTDTIPFEAASTVIGSARKLLRAVGTTALERAWRDRRQLRPSG